MQGLIRRTVGRRPLLTAVIAIGVLAALLPASVVFAQQAPPGTSPRYQSRFQVASAPAQFELVQAGYNFPPGAWTPDQISGGTTFNTVMSGQITVRANGSSKVYNAGDSWSDAPGQVRAVGNISQANANVFTSVILPQGANLTTNQGAGALPAGPRTLFLNRFPVSDAPAPLDLVQVELDQDPGSVTAVHTHPGAAYNTVVAGRLEVLADGTSTTYNQGQSWVNAAGQQHAVRNVTSAQSAAFTTFLVPRDATQLTTQVATQVAVAPTPKPAATAAPMPAGPPPSTLPVTGGAPSPLADAWPVALALLAMISAVAIHVSRPRRSSP